MWSRITGYYRPVQNWNDGKVQEFHDRREYELGASRLEGRRLQDREVDAQEANQPQTGLAEGLYLFTTNTCPNCVIAKRGLDAAGLEYTVMDAGQHEDLVRKYQIRQAPTLIVHRDGQDEKLDNLSLIRDFVTRRAANS